MATLFAGTSIPVGSILSFGGPSTAVPDGFLLCNGAEINRNDFADLFNVIGTKWGSGNGSTTFRVPTTQGLLLRGVAYGSGNDPDRATRNAVQTGGQTGDEVGSFQNWRVQSHAHNGGVVIPRSTVSNQFGNVRVIIGTSNNNNAVNTAFNFATANSGGNQTVGQNVYVNFIIKY